MNVKTPVVRAGADVHLPRDKKTGEQQHTLLNVYSEMLLQVCLDYRALPDPRTLTMSEIRFFYGGIRASLKSATRPKKA